MSEIAAKHVAVGGAFLHQPHEATREADEEAAGLGPFEWRGGRVVEHDKVDVARVIELERAALPHQQQDVAAALLGICRVLDFELVRGAAQKIAHRPAERRIGEFSERRGHPFDRPDPADIGERDQQRGFTLGAPQRAHCVGLTVRFTCAACIREHGPEMLFRFGLEDRREADGVRPDQVPEVG
jgi:hypothetical protein